MSEETVFVEWYCGYYVGLDECSTSFTTEVDKWDWDNNQAEAVCPSCSAHVWQAYDNPKLADKDSPVPLSREESEGNIESNLADLAYRADLMSYQGPDEYTI